MTEYTRPATWDDVKTVTRLLNEAGCRYALIGGYAIAAHGYVRFSEDVDILVDPSPENTRRWITALGQLPDRASLDLQGEDDLFAREGPYAVRINDVFTVDVLPAACGHPWEELQAYVEELDLDGDRIRVLNLEGLLLTKEGTRDPRAYSFSDPRGGPSLPTGDSFPDRAPARSCGIRSRGERKYCTGE